MVIWNKKVKSGYLRVVPLQRQERTTIKYESLHPIAKHIIFKRRDENQLARHWRIHNQVMSKTKKLLRMFSYLGTPCIFFYFTIRLLLHSHYSFSLSLFLFLLPFFFLLPFLFAHFINCYSRLSKKDRFLHTQRAHIGSRCTYYLKWFLNTCTPLYLF